MQKATIIARGTALGYTLNLPEEERYLHTKEELIDWMVVTLAGRAAEQVVFGRVTNGAANDLEKVTELARAMVFEYGMGEGAPARTMRADNYALSEESKRLRDQEQTRLTDQAYAEALRLIAKHRALLDRVAAALLEKETLGREELLELFGDVEPESRAAEAVGVPQVVAADPGDRLSRRSASRSRSRPSARVERHRLVPVGEGDRARVVLARPRARAGRRARSSRRRACRPSSCR